MHTAVDDTRRCGVKGGGLPAGESGSGEFGLGQSTLDGLLHDDERLRHTFDDRGRVAAGIVGFTCERRLSEGSMQHRGLKQFGEACVRHEVLLRSRCMDCTTADLPCVRCMLACARGYPMWARREMRVQARVDRRRKSTTK